MKVVIDIPESYYEACKQWKEGHVAQVAEMIVADGKPYDERPTGHWIKTISENGVTSAVRCSECGFGDNRYMLFRYCPNCGANMQGGV